MNGEERDARGALTRSASIVSVAVMASRVLGLAREVVLAHLFPAGLTLDAFQASFRLPNMLRDLFGEGALSKAFITGFTETSVREGDAALWRLVNRILNLLLLVSAALAVIGILCAPTIVGWLLPGAGFDTPLPAADSYGFATKRDLTVFLTRVMMPFLPLVTLAAVSMGLLNSKERFGVPALSSAFFNIGSIGVGVAGYVLGPRVGLHPVAGMAAGVTAGGLLQWVVMAPGMYRIGYRWRPELSFSDPDVRRIGKLIAPATIGIAAVQINVFFNTVMASYGDGWNAWINVSFRLIYLPVGIFGVAISTANLPSLTRAATVGNTVEFRETLSHALRLLLVLTIPSSVGLALLCRPIIRLIYEHGAFTAFDTKQAAWALFYYALGLTGYSAIKIVTDAFYALGDARTPLRYSVASIGLNLALSAVMIFGFGWDHRGLALATTIAVTFNFLAVLIALRRRVGRVDGRAILGTTLRSLAAACVMGAASLAVSQGIGWWLGTTSTGARVIQVLLAVGTGIAVFGALAKLLRMQEIDDLFAMLRKG